MTDITLARGESFTASFRLDSEYDATRLQDITITCGRYGSFSSSNNELIATLNDSVYSRNEIHSTSMGSRG